MRHRGSAPRSWGEGSGSEMEDSGGGRAAGVGRPASRGKDARGGGGGRARDARSRRAAALAAGDDADIAALREELAGGGLGGLGGEGATAMELEVDAEELGGGGSGGFGSVFGSEPEAPLLGGAGGRRGSDDLSQLSQLRQRFGQARIS